MFCMNPKVFLPVTARKIKMCIHIYTHSTWVNVKGIGKDEAFTAFCPVEQYCYGRLGQQFGCTWISGRSWSASLPNHNTIVNVPRSISCKSFLGFSFIMYVIMVSSAHIRRLCQKRRKLKGVSGKNVQKKPVLMLIYSEFPEIQLMPGVYSLPKRYAEIKHANPCYVCSCTFSMLCSE